MCILRYSGFLLVVPANTGIFLQWFKTMRRKQNLPSALGIQKENWGNHAFFRDNKCSILKKKTTYIGLYFTAFWRDNIVTLMTSKKCPATPNFLSVFQ